MYRNAKVTTRNYGIDLLRIIAMFMIVNLHVLGQGGAMARLTNAPAAYSVAWLLESAALCAVNCYGLISGYMGVKSRHRPARLMELYLTVWLYSVILTAIYTQLNPLAIARMTVPDKFKPLGVGAYQLLRALLPISFKSWWYFSAFAAVFVLEPYLNRLVLALKEGECRRLFWILFMLFSVLTLAPKAFGLDHLVLVGGYTFVWLLVLYLMGACLRMGNFRRRNKWIYLAGYALCVLFSWGFKEIVDNLDRQNFGQIYYGRTFLTYHAPTMVLCGVCLVLFFDQLKVESEVGIRIIRFLAPLSFSVYIIHTHPMVWELTLKSAFSAYRYFTPGELAWKVPLTALGIFLICVAIDFVRSLCFKLLRVRNWCERVWQFVRGKLIREAENIEQI